MKVDEADSFDLRVISLGAGVQSSALYLMALDGELAPRPDVAIFADTQREPPWVYENLWRLADEGAERIPILVASKGDLGAAMTESRVAGEGKFAAVPFFIENDDGTRGVGRRQCTNEYKIEVVNQTIRQILGLRKRQRAKGKIRVETWVGISVDEVVRAKPSQKEWVTTRWPFLFDRPLHRYEIKEWMRRRGWPEVKHSACVFCPFRNPIEWARWRDEHPDLFVEACGWDDAIRDGGTARGLRGRQFILDTLRPLRELPPREELERDSRANLNLFENECEGMCGV